MLPNTRTALAAAILGVVALRYALTECVFAGRSTAVCVIRLAVSIAVSAVDLLRLTHGALDGETTHVVPVLLEQTDKVVDGENDVRPQLLVGHLDVSNGDTHAEHLLQLELDTGLDLPDLVLHVVAVGQLGGELARLVESGSEEPGNLRQERLRGEEGTVLVGQLLDEGLVPVELLETLKVDVIDSKALGLVTVHLVTEHADAKALTGNVLQHYATAETLVPLGIIVLERYTCHERGNNIRQQKTHWHLTLQSHCHVSCKTPDRANGSGDEQPPNYTLNRAPAPTHNSVIRTREPQTGQYSAVVHPDPPTEAPP
ncbi:short-chain dehydrogenase, putative [Babesia ovata]|uniref:Short-chain dehydrogenase, putative n=1 Tax=Babesia ovata TaxID=189622 RepID=A0A2H6K8Q1_9APIC|nr:short-chain dehydrogenase, putative [Babesia ovata]GBE59374.1 short-chain dehydrogenase, putative [Babesia ovata]